MIWYDMICYDIIWYDMIYNNHKIDCICLTGMQVFWSCPHPLPSCCTQPLFSSWQHCLRGVLIRCLPLLVATLDRPQMLPLWAALRHFPCSKHMRHDWSIVVARCPQRADSRITSAGLKTWEVSTGVVELVLTRVRLSFEAMWGDGGGSWTWNGVTYGAKLSSYCKLLHMYIALRCLPSLRGVCVCAHACMHCMRVWEEVSFEVAVHAKPSCTSVSTCAVS